MSPENPSPIAGEPTNPTAGEFPAPSVPDHEVLRRIGVGGYGEVWLARNQTTGTFRAVKVVRRQKFCDAKPYDREFRGIKAFEPVSRSHEGLVDILHVGENAGEGYFYYVMELADDLNPECGVQGAESGPPPGTVESHPGSVPAYVPKTLAAQLARHGRMARDECLKLGLNIAGALERLHASGLVHRDVKPSNIIFVDGVPKLADIGLVARTDEPLSRVGTEEFVPLHGAGTPQGDLFALGKVLYQAASGKGAERFPEPATELTSEPDQTEVAELNQVVLKACEDQPKERYRNAAELRADLLLLQSGRSLVRLRKNELQIALARRAAFAALPVALVLVAVGWLVVSRNTWHRASIREADTRQAQMLLFGEHRDGWSSNAVALLRSAGKLRMGDDVRAQAMATIAQADLRVARVFTNAAAHHVAFDAEGLRLLVDGAGEGRAKLIDLRSSPPRDLNSTNAGPIWFAGDAGPRQFAYQGNGVFTVMKLEDGEVLGKFHLDRGEEVAQSDVRALAVSDDGSLCAAAVAGTALSEIAVWETPTGRLLTNSYEACTALAFSPNADCLAMGDDAGRVIVRSLPDWNELPPFHQDRAPIHCLAFRRDLSQPVEPGSKHPWLLAAGDAAGTVNIYQLAERRLISICRGSSYNVYAVTSSPDGMTLASGGRVNPRLWDVATGRELARLGEVDFVKALLFSPDGTRLAVGSESVWWPGQARVLEPLVAKEIRTLRGLSAQSGKPTFSHDGQWLAALAQNWEIGIWNLASNRLDRLLTAPRGELADNAALAFSRDDRRIAFATSEVASMWDRETGHRFPDWKVPRGLNQRLCFDAAGRLVHFQWERPDPGAPGVCCVRNLLAADYTNALGKFSPFEGTILDSAMSSDGRFAVVCGASPDPGRTNHTVGIYDCLTGKLSVISSSQHALSDAVALDPTGGLLAYWDARSSQTRLYEIPGGRPVRTHPSYVNALSPSGHWLANGAGGVQGLTLTKSEEPGWSITLGIGTGVSPEPQFSPDGGLLAWGTPEGAVMVCDVKQAIRWLEQNGFGW